MRPRGLLWGLLVVLGPACPAAAGISASGYLKDLYDYTRGPLTRDPYWLNLSRARLSLDAAAGDGPRLQAKVDYDHEVRAGSYFRTPDFRVAGFPEPPAYFDMEQAIGAGGSYDWRHKLYRGWVGVEDQDSTARFGRQRVAWGVGKLWNPTDALNPYQPASLERDERRGVDAVYLRRAIGALGQGEAAYALAGNWAACSLLARLHGNRGGADFSLMGGKVSASSASWMAGGDFSSNFLEGNLHGELSYSDLKVRTPYWRGLIGYEYNFPASAPRLLKDAWVLAEYFHNGNGEVDPARYQPGKLLSGADVSLARNYAGFGYKDDLHPLLNLEVYEILNLDDSGHFLNAALTWDAAKNLYLSAGIQRFGGIQRSEFGRSANVVYFQGQYFF